MRLYQNTSKVLVRWILQHSYLLFIHLQITFVMIASYQSEHYGCNHIYYPILIRKIYNEVKKPIRVSLDQDQASHIFNLEEHLVLYLILYEMRNPYGFLKIYNLNATYYSYTVQIRKTFDVDEKIVRTSQIS